MCLSLANMCFRLRQCVAYPPQDLYCTRRLNEADRAAKDTQPKHSVPTCFITSFHTRYPASDEGGRHKATIPHAGECCGYIGYRSAKEFIDNAVYGRTMKPEALSPTCPTLLTAEGPRCRPPCYTWGNWKCKGIGLIINIGAAG